MGHVRRPHRIGIGDEHILLTASLACCFRCSGVMLFLAAVTRSHRATYIGLVSVSLILLCFGTVLFTHRLWFY